MVKVAALIVAAGSGSRVAGAGQPKQYLSFGGRPLLAHTLAPCLAHPRVSQVLVVIRSVDRALYAAALAAIGQSAKLLPPVVGGATRQESVLHGLRALRPARPDLLLVHDAARPYIGAALITRVLDALDGARAVIAAVPLTDTLKRVNLHGLVEATIARDGLWRAQTPQAFRFDEILAAHEAAADAGRKDFTDDSEIAEWAGLPVTVVEGGAGNVKITSAEDVAMAEKHFAGLPLPDVRTGQGVDVHRFARGDHVWLCGIKVPHDRGLEGHSDADVGLHALTDALLGAIADGDIGQHFRNDDPRWRGAASDLFLADAARRVAALDARITNVDVTLLCEWPKIDPHRDAMRHRIADILDLEPERVAVKATTTESLGFTGRREGIMAMATATVVFPAPL